MQSIYTYIYVVGIYLHFVTTVATSDIDIRKYWHTYWYIAMYVHTVHVMIKTVMRTPGVVKTCAIYAVSLQLEHNLQYTSMC